VVSLAACILTHGALVRLWLAGNRIGRRGATNLAEHLSPSLKHVDVSGNRSVDGSYTLIIIIIDNHNLPISISINNNINDHYLLIIITIKNVYYLLFN